MLKGLRYLPLEIRAGISNVSLVEVSLHTPYKSSEESKFWLPADITINSQNADIIPHKTSWHIEIDANYPYGSITFYPSATGGITKTFQHQSYNSIEDGKQYRNGNICLSFNALKGEIADFNKNTRLNTFFKRAVEWLEAASNNQLIQEGEYFELPSYGDYFSEKRVLLRESKSSFKDWVPYFNTSGYFSFFEPFHSNGSVMIEAFYNKNNKSKPIVDYKWGSIKNFKHNGIIPHSKFGKWFLFNKIPMMPPWEGIRDWNKFLDWLGQDKNQFISRLGTKSLEEFSFSNLILIGFPVPQKIKGVNDYIIWKGCEIPDINKPQNGFKQATKKSNSINTSLIKHNLKMRKKIDWIPSDSGHPDFLNSRGPLSNKFSDLKIAIIGLGAIGAELADQLARAGIKELTLIDNDIVEPGNLTRHVLTMEDAGKTKVAAMENYLSKVSPNVKINIIADKVPFPNTNNSKEFDGCDLIIDCTGENSIIAFFDDNMNELDATFVSVSVSYKAKHLCFYMGKCKNINYNEFCNSFDDKINYAPKEVASNQIPIPNVGCWHPAFPARVSNVRLMTSLAFNQLEAEYEKFCVDQVNRLFLMEYKNEGVKIVRLPAN